MRPSAVTIIAIIAIFLTCCADPGVNRRLARAEALMMTAPDSALAILDSIDHAPLRGRRAALHALLLTHAHYRNYINDTDDSLITIAVDYFSGHDDPERLMAAYYCRGRVHDNAERYPEAMTDALHALDLATGRGDFFYEARAHELIGDLWYAGDSYRNSTGCAVKASALYHKAGKHDNGKWASLDASIGYANQGLFGKAVEMMDSLLADNETDTFFVYAIKEKSIGPLIWLNRLREAETRANELLNGSAFDKAHVFIHLSEIHSILGRKSAAKAALDSALFYGGANDNDCNAMGIKHSECLIRCMDGNPDSITMAFRTMIEAKDSMITSKCREDLSNAESAYYREQSLRIAKSSRGSNFMLYAAVAVAFAAALAGTYLYRRRMKEKDSAISMKMKDIAELSDERERLKSKSRLKDEAIGLLTDKVSALEKRYAGVQAVRPVANSVYSRMAIIKELGNIYAAYSGDRKTAKAKIWPIVIRILDEANDSKFINDVAVALDADTGGLVSEYAPAVVGKGKQNYEVFIYCMAGLTAKETSVLLNIPQSTVYGIRANIKNKIQAAESARKDEMMRFFE